jgi:hypothetical protein
MSFVAIIVISVDAVIVVALQFVAPRCLQV